MNFQPAWHRQEGGPIGCGQFCEGMPCNIILGWPTASFIGWTRCLLPYSFQSWSMQFCPENLYNLQQATTYVVLFYVHVFILIYYSSKQVLNTSQLFHFQSSSCTPGSAQSNVVIWWELPEPARNWPFRKELGPWAPVSRLENTKSPHWKKPCKVSVESCSLTWQEPLGSSEFIRKPSTIIDETRSLSEQVWRHKQNPQCVTGFSHRRTIFEKPNEPKHHLRLNACGWSNGSRSQGRFGAPLAFWEVVGWRGNFRLHGGVGWGWVGWQTSFGRVGCGHVQPTSYSNNLAMSRHVTLLSPNSIPPRAHVAHRSRTLEPSLGQLARSTHDNARRQLSRHSYRHSKAEAKTL